MLSNEISMFLSAIESLGPVHWNHDVQLATVELIVQRRSDLHRLFVIELLPETYRAATSPRATVRYIVGESQAALDRCRLCDYDRPMIKIRLSIFVDLIFHSWLAYTIAYYFLLCLGVRGNVLAALPFLTALAALIEPVITVLVDARAHQDLRSATLKQDTEL